jgi:predicted kinase
MSKPPAHAIGKRRGFACRRAATIQHMRSLLITGLPGSGKSTLARRLALRFAVPLLGKDLIKEPLLRALGARSTADSRLLSDASFDVQFAIAGELLTANLDFILEGNFRPGEHEAALSALAAVRMAQVLCRTDEPTRLARLARRKAARHAGHHDTDPAVIARRTSDAFLELPGERLTFEGGETALAGQIDAIDRWWRQG